MRTDGERNDYKKCHFVFVDGVIHDEYWRPIYVALKKGLATFPEVRGIIYYCVIC